MLVENIKKLCKDNGISIAALEKRVGIGNATISRWNTSSPRSDKLKAVADYFGVTVDALLKDDTTIQKPVSN